MKEFYTKESEKVLGEIREALESDGIVKVHNAYETFYGVGFDRWLRNGLSDLDVEIEVTAWNGFGYGYPWIYVIRMVR